MQEGYGRYTNYKNNNEKGEDKMTTKMDYARFIKELRMIRLSNDMTIKGLYEASGVSRATISEVETGKINPSLKTVITMLENMGDGYELRIIKSKKGDE